MCTTHIKIFRFASRSFLVKWAPKRVLATKYARGSKNFPAKKLRYIFLKSYFFFLLFSSSTPFPLPARRNCSSSYQMSLLLLFADSATQWTLTAEPRVVGPSYSLDLVKRVILIWELRDELWGQGILRENFPYPSPCRRSVSNCWTLGCWPVVISTTPRSSCWENNFGTSWWSMRSRNLTELWDWVILTENILSPRPWTWIVRPRIYLTGKFL